MSCMICTYMLPISDLYEICMICTCPARRDQCDLDVLYRFFGWDLYDLHDLHVFTVWDLDDLHDLLMLATRNL